MTTSDTVVPPSSAHTNLAVYLPAVAARWIRDAPERRYDVLDGTVVFADVTGFTPMTEKLTKRGKVGAEELTDILNDVFGRLLTVTSRFGGDLLKFGGDALLLLFTGDSHQLRACAAAEGMQVELRAFRRFRTEAGVLSLAMSAGVTSGPCHLYLVGESHRELVVAGPTFSRAVDLEGVAPSGRVAVGPTTAAALPERCLGEPCPDGWLLKAPPTAFELPPADSPVSPEVGELGVPTGLRSYLRTRREEGEHRLAVLTFLQFKGTDDLLADAGPEVVARALDALVRAVQDACDTHGTVFLATDIDRDGGKILLAAGAPSTTGADADATLLALREVLDRPSLLEVRAGVNVGRTFAVDVGSRDRRTFAVMGDATNLAARVMGRAAPGQIVATQDVLDRVLGRFALTRLEPFMVKGKSMPISAQLVGPALLEQGRDRTAELPLFGRREEYVALLRAVDGARHGTGAAVLLLGDPGTGKTRLLEELLAHVDDLTHLLVKPGPYSAATPYLALRAPLRGLLGIAPTADDRALVRRLRAVVDDSAPHLAPLLPLLALPLGIELEETPETAGIAAAFRRARVNATVGELLFALLSGPSLLAVDDAQWLDDASADLVQHLVAGLDEGPMAIVVSRRAGDDGLTVAGRGHTVVELGPLASDTAAELVVAAAGDVPLASHVRQALVARGGGNPLFIIELVRAAARGGDVDALPDTVEEMVAASVDQVSPADRADLRLAAVLGPRFPLTLLERVLADAHEEYVPDGDSPRARSAVARLSHFLTIEDEDVRFLHGLVRDAAYEGLAYRRRRSLHGRVGDLIAATAGDGDDAADLLSTHFSLAGRHALAWTWTRRAAHRARRLAAPVEAATHLRRALEAAGHLDLRDDAVAETHELLGETCQLLGLYTEAANALRSARRLRADDRVGIARLHVKEGRLRNDAGAYTSSLRWYTKGLRLLDGLPASASVHAARAQLVVGYAGTRCDQGRWSAALPWLERAVAEATAADDRSTLAWACYLFDWSLTELGRPEAAAYRGQAQRLYEELGDHVGLAKVYNNAGADAYFAGQWDEAIRLYNLHGVEFARAGDLVRVAVSTHNIAEVLSDQGRVEEAEPLFRDALSTWRASGYRVGVAMARSNLARALVRAGRPDEAGPLYEQAREGFRAIGADAYVLETDAREAERLLLLDKPASAFALVEATEARCDAEGGGGQGVLLAMLDRIGAGALAQSGRPKDALERLERSVERARAVDAQFELALSLLDLGRLHLAWPAQSWSDENRGEEAVLLAGHILDGLGVIAVPAPPLRPV